MYVSDRRNSGGSTGNPDDMVVITDVPGKPPPQMENTDDLDSVSMSHSYRLDSLVFISQITMITL